MQACSGAIALTALLAACGAEELNSGGIFVCEEIGRTIANVSWSCGSALDAASARGRRFAQGYQCGGPTTALGEYELEVGLACPVAMAQTPCEVAAAAGDDLMRWIEAVPSCQGIVSPGPSGGGS